MGASECTLVNVSKHLKEIVWWKMCEQVASAKSQDSLIFVETWRITANNSVKEDDEFQ